MEPPRVLFVEDDEPERRAFFQMVRDKALAWEIRVAETLAEARAHLAESNFDVIIADNRLPDGESTELLGEISNIPFILVTGTLEEQLALRMRERGADDYLAKDVGRLYLEALPFAVEKTLYRKSIDERERQLIHELRESERRMRATFENAASGIVQTDSQDRFVAVNERLCLMLGYSREELLGKSVHELTYPEDRPRSDELNARIREGRMPWFQYEKRYLKRDGSPLWVHVGVSAVRDEGGRYLYSVGTVVDISARKAAEEQVRLQIAALEAAPNAVSVSKTDPQGTIVWVNQAFTTLTGYSAKEAIGHSHHLLSSGRQGEAFYHDLWETIKRGEVWRGELINRRKDGTLYHEEMAITPLRDELGNATHYVAIKQDITGRKKAEEALRQSEERFRALIQASSEVLYCMSPDWSEMRQLYSHGFLADTEVPSRTWLDVYIHPADQPYVLAVIDEAIRKRSIFELEHRVRRIDGSLGWTFSRAVPILGENGEITEWFGVASDITERKLAERALRESEARLRGILAGLQDAYFHSSFSGRLTYVSPSAVQMFGYDSAEEMMGLPAGTLYADPKDRTELIEEVRRSGRVNDWIVRGRRKDGSTFWVSINGQVRHGNTGQVVGIEAIVRDISDRKRSEEALRDQAALLDLAYDAIIVRDQENKIVFWSRGAEETYGWSASEAIGHIMQQLLKTHFPEPLVDLNVKLLQKGRWEGELIHTRKDGLEITVASRWAVKRDSSGRQVGVLEINRDITARKRAEEALAYAKQSAEQANQAKDHFLAVLSHELRTPLTPVVMGLSLLQDRQDVDKKMLETLEMVRRNVEMEARLIDDLLDVTRIARGKIELHRSAVELSTIINRSVEVCRPDIEARKLHFGVDPGPAAPYWVEADISRLQQVFWNLLKNAIKFTPAGGCVGIRCLPNEKHVLVEVNDSGIGIEAEALPRVFNAFEQAEASISRQFGGLGLGLAISKAIVEMHGGEIAAYSAGRGKGATFRVRLPLSASARQTEVSATAAPRRLVRTLRILLVEDHGVTAQMIREVLSEKGHTVEIAGDLSTALELADRSTFDLLLSDLGLPDGSGLDLIRELRMRGHKFPGIALSGYGQEQDIRRSYEAGFAAHLTKPASREAMFAAVAAAVTDKGHPNPDFSIIHPEQTSVPVFEAEEALKRCYGNRETLRQMVQFFPNESGELLGQMHAALGNADFAEVRRTAHRLKGSLFYLAAQPALDAVSRLEEAAKSENLAMAEKAVIELEHQVGLLRNALLSHAAKPESF